MCAAARAAAAAPRRTARTRAPSHSSAAPACRSQYAARRALATSPARAFSASHNTSLVSALRTHTRTRATSAAGSGGTHTRMRAACAPHGEREEGEDASEDAQRKRAAAVAEHGGVLGQRDGDQRQDGLQLLAAALAHCGRGARRGESVRASGRRNACVPKHAESLTADTHKEGSASAHSAQLPHRAPGPGSRPAGAAGWSAAWPRTAPSARQPAWRRCRPWTSRRRAARCQPQRSAGSAQRGRRDPWRRPQPRRRRQRAPPWRGRQEGGGGRRGGLGLGIMTCV